MTDDRMDETLKDLERMLAVEPSPEFAAGVRARVGKSTAPRHEWAFAVTAGLAAAVVIVLVLALSISRGRTPATDVAVARTPAPVPTAASPVPVKSTPSVARATKTEAVVASRPSTPEVIVPPGQAAAIRALVAGLNDGTIDPGSLATPPPDATVPLVPVEEIVIAPIVILPLNASGAAASGGGDGGIR